MNAQSTLATTRTPCARSGYQYREERTAEFGRRCNKAGRQPNGSDNIVAELTCASAAEFVGKELGASDWLTVEQSMINQFAECSGDRQWIHVDVERAKRESPYRAPIAHGYLTLSLVAPLQMEVG